MNQILVYSVINTDIKTVYKTFKMHLRQFYISFLIKNLKFLLVNSIRHLNVG